MVIFYHSMLNGILGSNAFMGSTTSSLSLSISIIQLPFSRFDEVSSFKNDLALENFFTQIYLLLL